MNKFLIGAISLIMAVSVGILSAIFVVYGNNDFKSDKEVVSDSSSLNILEKYEEQKLELSEKNKQLELIVLQLKEKEDELLEKQTLFNELQAEKQSLISQLENSNNSNLEISSRLETVEAELVQAEKDIEFLENWLNGYEEDLKEMISTVDVYKASGDNTINLGIASNVQSVINTSNSTAEENYKISNHGTEFNKFLIDVEMTGITHSTRRFLSKDGDKIYFLNGVNLIGYKNENNTMNQILNVTVSHTDIFNISAFGDFVFIFTDSAPYVHAYIIENEALTKCTLNISTDFSLYSNLENFFGADAVQSKYGTVLIGFMTPVETTSAYTLFYNYNESTKTFTFDTHLQATNYNFSVMLAMHNTVYSDAQIMYLQAGEKSSLCKRAVHKADKTIQDTYSATTYYYTYLTTEIFARGRDIVFLKDYDPAVWFYKYPQVYRDELHNCFNLTGVVDVAVSFNGVYKAFQYSDGSFKVINNADFNSFIEIELPEDLNVSEIEDFEILNNVMIFFLSDGTNRVYSFKENMLLIENVSSKSGTYEVTVNGLFTVNEILEKKIQLEYEVAQLEKELSDTTKELKSKLSEATSKLNAHHDLLVEHLDLFEHYYNSDETVVTILFTEECTLGVGYFDLNVWTLNLETKSLFCQTFRQFADYEINQQDDLLVINLDTKENLSYDSYTWKVSLSTGDYTIEFVEKEQIEDYV